ncbi:hypothetical protein AXF14_08450 [Actinomyces radicidentis]|uniref:N-acetyltransferase domain-containing protein n=1 Tax=Actinomyces radicidentis TaxID=111015 RepID=A0A0X8JEZ5_ACTRD|nr:GNAT family N-acetyltransferase [Actinomyces radicidentis]AMD87609.1 hypothetical protein AXF14_08450 [Actinomyces radicidentis]
MTGPKERPVRPVTPDELEGEPVHRLMHLASGHDGERLERVIHDDLPDLTTLVVGNETDGRTSQPLALAAYRAPRAVGEDVVLEYLAVLEEHQHEGLASRLIDALRRRHPGSAVHAETDDDAIGFYRRLGFGTGPGPVDPRWPGTRRYTCRLEPAASLRPATRADCPAILDVMFSTAMSRESTWWRTTVGDLETRLAEGSGFVAERDGRVVGCVMHVVEGDRLVLRGLAVRPEAEGQGIGSALVAAVESVAAAQGRSEVLLAVSASNLEVCDFYRCLGYADSTEPCTHAAAGRPAPTVLVKALAA